MNNVRGKNTRRKHLSKNKKKSWRKVDTNDVEEFLEDERLQERTGGKVSEKSDASLFFVDKKVTKGKGGLKDKVKRKRKAQEELKVIEEALKPPPKKKKDKRISAVIEREASGKLTDTQKQAFKQRRKARNQKLHQVRTRGKNAPVNYDLWGDTLDSELVGQDEHFITVTKKKRVKAPDRLQLPVSSIPAVEIPHPGTSYNPAYDEYQDLLQKAHSKELKKIKQEERIKRALDEKFPSARDAPTEANHLQEMSAGLFHNSDNEDEDEEGDLDKLSVNPPVRRENKKDERKRKKEKAMKEKAQLAEKEKQKRIKNNNFFRLRSIKAEIKADDKVFSERRKKKEEKKARDLSRTKTLSKNKFEEPDLEVKLSDELTGSLREMRPEGHILLDRFNSLMKRNILEVRGRPIPKKQKKYKPKVFEKKTHREIKSV
ncbi:ribosome biogenesis protein NOP53-like [Ruditapes philippinarum]|uniref:ribosome biogenesis protein NOP53-like n=1 Tax=Ruditapes philippinarum TaxID=129788 RepID=UPI00295A9E23|nr:ribosome biogenesis protein NOP53-like [Ruditapes philippinarum]